MRTYYGVEIRRTDGRREGYELPRATRESATREARNAAMLVNVARAAVTIEDERGLRALVWYESPDGQTVREVRP